MKNRKLADGQLCLLKKKLGQIAENRAGMKEIEMHESNKPLEKDRQRERKRGNPFIRLEKRNE